MRRRQSETDTRRLTTLHIHHHRSSIRQTVPLRFSAAQRDCRFECCCRASHTLSAHHRTQTSSAAYMVCTRVDTDLVEHDCVLPEIPLHSLERLVGCFIRRTHSSRRRFHCLGNGWKLDMLHALHRIQTFFFQSISQRFLTLVFLFMLRLETKAPWLHILSAAAHKAHHSAGPSTHDATSAACLVEFHAQRRGWRSPLRDLHCAIHTSSSSTSPPSLLRMDHGAFCKHFPIKSTIDASPADVPECQLQGVLPTLFTRSKQREIKDWNASGGGMLDNTSVATICSSTVLQAFMSPSTKRLLQSRFRSSALVYQTILV